MVDSMQLKNPETGFTPPSVVSLNEQMKDRSGTFVPLAYQGLLCQDEERAIDLPIFPTNEDYDKLLFEKGLTPEDKQKYFDIVRQLHEEARIPMTIEKKCSLQEILTFCALAMWRITGTHNEALAEKVLHTSTHVRASSLVDINDPPITKCSFFNSAFSYLFEAACTYFERTEFLKNYQLIAVKDIPTHLYLALVSSCDGQYQISALDPYHTTTKSNPDAIFEELDQTKSRGEALTPAFWKAINWK